MILPAVLDARGPAAPLRILCLGAHCDDIEIGCGGTLLQLLAARPRVEVTWVVFSSPGVREQEARASAAQFLGEAQRTAYEEKHRGELLRQALTHLSHEHREIIDLVYYHERSIAECAEIVGIPAATVKTRMFYAHGKLAELVRDI